MKKKKRNIVLLNVVVEAYAAEGKSLARRDGKVVFIDGAVPGDVVDVQLGRNKADWAEGHPIKFHTYSAERALPFCQHFGVCGGCQWQMLPYAKQLQFKQQQVWDNLTRIGKIPLPEMQPIIGAAKDTFYRNKLEFTFSTKEYTEAKPTRPPSSILPPTGEGGAATQPMPVNGAANTLESWNVNAQAPPGEGWDEAASTEANNFTQNTASPTLSQTSSTHPEELLRSAPATPSTSLMERGPGGEVGALGFHAKGFFDKIVQIQTCWLQPEPQNEVRNAVRAFAMQKGYTFYNFREHTGLLRNLQFRVCTTGEVMVNVVFGEADEAKRNTVLSFINTSFPAITTLLYTVNLKWNDSLFDQQPIACKGKGYVIEKLGDFQFKIGPKSFFQTNTAQAEKLYEVTRRFAELDGSQTLYDLYCGTGSIGIFCSAGAKKIIGVEAIEAAITDAKENAILNGIGHAEFFAGDVIDVCTDAFFAEHGRPQVIITDPPRAGMHAKLIEKILEIQAPLVVYVSCNPATQARDLALLNARYTVTAVQPVDMFPHTHHIENVVQLKLKTT